MSLYFNLEFIPILPSSSLFCIKLFSNWSLKYLTEKKIFNWCRRPWFFLVTWTAQGLHFRRKKTHLKWPRCSDIPTFRVTGAGKYDLGWRYTSCSCLDFPQQFERWCRAAEGSRGLGRAARHIITLAGATGPSYLPPCLPNPADGTQSRWPLQFASGSQF